MLFCEEGIESPKFDKIIDTLIDARDLVDNLKMEDKKKIKMKKDLTKLIEKLGTERVVEICNRDWIAI